MRKTVSKFALAAGFVLAMVFTSCTSRASYSPPTPRDGTFTDSRDGKTYKTVKIGEQTWMAENLNYVEEGSVCYDNKPENCAKYGRLYNWNTAEIACPEGWHLPDKEEWQTLVNFAGGERVAGKRLKARSGWNNNGNGMDSYGFSALPGGQGNSSSFSVIGLGGVWWVNSVGYYFGMSYSADGAVVAEVGSDESTLVYVRCVQGKAQSSAASGVSGEQQGAQKRYAEVTQEALQELQKQYAEAQKAQQEAMQEAQQEVQKAQQEVQKVHPEWQKAQQEARKQYVEAIQKAQQEADVQKRNEAIQKAQQELQEAQPEWQKQYAEAIQKAQQELQKQYAEAQKRYAEAMQKAQQELQEAMQK